MDLKNKKVIILGTAKSGQAVARLVLSQGGIPKISETKDEVDLDEGFRAWLEEHDVECEFDGHTEAFMLGSDYCVISPGVNVHSAPLQWMQEHGIPTFGEIEFAYTFCSKPIIAVTGSNGKTTVSTLISKVLTQCGHSNLLCGNIGKPFSDHVLNLKGEEFVVLEVSSFQLESIIDFKPHIAVFLNFSQNHLDRHEDIDEYFHAKSRIFMNQAEDDYAILNGEDSRMENLGETLNAQVMYYTDLKTMGVYNPNHLAVMQVAKILDLNLSKVQNVLNDFKGIEHRMEWVRQLNGIDFINDSKATTAQAGRWAMTNVKDPIIMICGGRDKNIDFEPLRPTVQEKVKRMIVIGEAKDKIKKTFEDVVPIEECQELEGAVSRAYSSANQGDKVIFSPMCASFDMFKNFEERGNVFKEIVLSLK